MPTFRSNSFTPVPNGGAQYRLAIAVTVASQDVTANTSRVDWYMVIEKDRSYRGFYEYTAHHSVTIDGSVVHDQTNASPNAEWRGWSQHLLASGTSIITHNADGTRSLSVSGAWERSALGWSPGSMYVSGSFELPTIARATQPKVTPGTAAVGATVKIDLPRASSSFTHDVTWKSGTLSGTVGTGIATTANFVVPSVMGEFPGQTRAPITFTAVTKNGATTIGSKSVTLQATNPPPAPAIRELKPGQEFDIRARLVEWDAASSEWRRGKILPTISLSMVDPASSTTTCSLTMSKRSAVDFDDHSIIDIDVFDGENWRFTNHRFVLSRIEGDDVDPSETFTYSGTEYVDYILGFAYVQSDIHWDGGQNHWGPTSPGDMLKYSTTLAKQRGWGTRFDTAFDMNKTTFGDPWTNRTINRVLSAGTPISQVLDGLVTDGYAEYQTEYHSNKAWLVLLNPGTGTSFADVGASPIVNLSLAKLSRAPRRGTSEKRITRVTVVGDTAEGGNSPVRSTREKTPFNSNVFGHMEGWVSASGVKDSGEVAKIGDNALRDNSSVVNERTFEYDAQDASPQFFPYVVFRPGDWILTPGNDAPVSDRISQITISKSEDSKSITILTGDRILSGQASLAKRQAAQTGGAIAGGTGMSPAPIDSRIPAQPVIDTVTSIGYWTTDGTARSEITVKWAPVTDSLSGSPISTDLYEVWWREAVGGVWKFRAATSDTEIDMPDWEVLKNYELRVRARSTAGIFGEFSENIEHTTPEPAVDLDGPILSDLYTDGLGNIYASWDGTLGGVPAPNRVGYIAAEVSSDGGTVYTQMGTPITAMGTIVIAPGSYGEFKVRLRAFDGLGNPGDASLPQTITTENPHINEIVTLSSTTQALVSPSGGGTTTPATAVITGTATNTTITSWEYAVDGAAFTATVPAGVSRNVNVVTITGATMTAKTIAVRASDAHGASDTLTVAKLMNGATGANGVSVTGAVVTYQVSTSGTTTPTGTWNSSVPSVPAGQFLWTRTVTSYSNSTSTTSYSVGSAGTNGANGAPGAPGSPGANSYFHVAYATNSTGTAGFSTTDPTGKTYVGTYSDNTAADSTDPAMYDWMLVKGADGATGKGITGSAVTYQTSASGTTAPTGTWNSAVPSVPAGQFLWTRTVLTFTDGATTTTYSVARAGTDGAPGTGISSSTVTYQASTSGTTAPTGTWNSSVPSVPAGQFLWTRTVIAFTDGGSTTTYSVARMGTNGTNGTNGVSVTGAVVTYQTSASGTTEPTGAWSGTVPSVPAGQFLWTRTVTSYSNSTSTTSYAVSYAGTNGANGTPSYFHVAYATNSTGTAGFSTTDPTGKTYVGTYSDSTAADSTDPAMYDWMLVKGADGATGKGITGSAVTYQTSASGTTTPTGTWSGTVPSVSAGQFLWTRTVLTFSDGATTTSYAVSRAGTNGTNGTNGVSVTGAVVTYQASASGTTTPTGTWNSSVPSVPAGQFLWTRTVTSYSNSTSTTSYSVGSAGTNGANGQTSYIHVAYATNSTGTAGFSTTDPAGKTYLGTYTDFVAADSTDPTKYLWSLIKGADGAAAYTVILSNESHTFPGTASAAVAGSTTSRVFAYKGATASNATVGTITGAPTGMTTSVSGNGTTAPIITINVATTLVTQSGVLTVPITVDGVSFSKTISWSVARSLVGAKVPLSPTALTATPGAGWDESGSFPTAWFDVAWTAPTLDTEGAPVAIAGYDLWGKKTSDPEMRFITSVAAPQTRVAVGDGEEWSFQVLAVSSTGGKSELTAAITVVANATTPAAPAPGVPSLDQYAGLLRIKWSGAGMLPQIKTVYATISSSAAGPYTRAGMPLTGAGEVVVPGLAPAQYWAKIVMEDERGLLSTSAAAGPITLLPITGVTIQTSPVANTGIKITDAALTAYDVSGNPTFIVDATTGSVWIAPYDAVFEFGATGIVAETGTATTGVQISSENSSFNTFIHAAGVQIRNDQTPLSWWEADASDASLVNFVAPRARVDDRFRIGDYEFLREAKAGNKSRLVIRYRGA